MAKFTLDIKVQDKGDPAYITKKALKNALSLFESGHLNCTTKIVIDDNEVTIDYMFVQGKIRKRRKPRTDVKTGPKPDDKA